MQLYTWYRETTPIDHLTTSHLIDPLLTASNLMSGPLLINKLSHAKDTNKCKTQELWCWQFILIGNTKQQNSWKLYNLFRKYSDHRGQVRSKIQHKNSRLCANLTCSNSWIILTNYVRLSIKDFTIKIKLHCVNHQ